MDRGTASKRDGLRAMMGCKTSTQHVPCLQQTMDANILGTMTLRSGLGFPAALLPTTWPAPAVNEQPRAAQLPVPLPCPQSPSPLQPTSSGKTSPLFSHTHAGFAASAICRGPSPFHPGPVSAAGLQAPWELTAVDIPLLQVLHVGALEGSF